MYNPVAYITKICSDVSATNSQNQYVKILSTDEAPAYNDL